VRERERVFLRWLERLLNQPVNRDAAYKAGRDGYTVREYAAEFAALPLARIDALTMCPTLPKGSRR
jgi:hypothetical protein